MSRVLVAVWIVLWVILVAYLWQSAGCSVETPC
jgi:hypothetical protein